MKNPELKKLAKQFAEVTIKHDKQDAAKEQIEFIVSCDDISIIVLTGPTGSGKSTLLEQFASEYLASREPEMKADPSLRPIAYATATASGHKGFDWKALYKTTQKNHGDPFAATRSRRNDGRRPSTILPGEDAPAALQREQTESAFLAADTKLWIIDEAQHVLRGGKSGTPGDQYDILKSLAQSAGVQLIPIGPHGSLTVSATLKLPVGLTNWIGFGLGSSNHFVAAEASKSGPWVKVQGNGSITLYGGSGENNPLTVSTAFTNAGSPVKFVLGYDAFVNSASVSVVQSGVTNPVFNLVPVTNSWGSVTARFLNFQFPASASPASARWVSDVSVDWFPRPRPLLTLPTTPPANVIQVGPPTGQSDIALIQAALNAAAALTNGAEVRFTAGATYLIATNTTSPGRERWANR